MSDVTELVSIVFSGLSALIIEDVQDAGEVIVVRARTADEAVACPGCGTPTGRVHGYHERVAADVPVDGRRVLVRLRARRMRCPVTGCPRQTFREQVPGLIDRYQRSTLRLAGQVSAVARELAGRAGARLLRALGILVSRHTALRVLLRIPLPVMAVPRVLGIDDFALRRGSSYATVLIDAETGRRVDVLEGRTADVVEDWLRGHPGVEVVTRDGSGAYGEAVRSALPDAVQCGDRWHLWHLLAEAAAKEVAAHSACWAESCPAAGGQARGDDTRALAADPRPAGERRRAAGLLTPPGPGPQHGEAVRPHRCARAAAPRRPVPAHPRRSLPRLPAHTPHRGTRGPGAAAAAGDPRARLPGQLQPARPLHQPGTRRRRPAAHRAPQGHADPAHQAGQPRRRAAGDRRTAVRRMPGDDSPFQR